MCPHSSISILMNFSVHCDGQQKTVYVTHPLLSNRPAARGGIPVYYTEGIVRASSLVFSLLYLIHCVVFTHICLIILKNLLTSLSIIS